MFGHVIIETCTYTYGLGLMSWQRVRSEVMVIVGLLTHKVVTDAWHSANVRLIQLNFTKNPDKKPDPSLRPKTKT